MNETPDVREMIAPLLKATVWMKVVAVISIIQGLVAVISVWGIIVAWLPIWLGVVLWQGATRLDRAGGPDPAGDFNAAFGKLGKYFTLSAIFQLVFIGLAMVGIAAGILIPLLARSGKLPMGN